MNKPALTGFLALAVSTLAFASIDYHDASVAAAGRDREFVFHDSDGDRWG